MVIPLKSLAMTPTDSISFWVDRVLAPLHLRRIPTERINWIIISFSILNSFASEWNYYRTESFRSVCIGVKDLCSYLAVAFDFTWALYVFRAMPVPMFTRRTSDKCFGPLLSHPGHGCTKQPQKCGYAITRKLEECPTVVQTPRKADFLSGMAHAVEKVLSDASWWGRAVAGTKRLNES